MLSYLDLERFTGSSADSLADLSDLACDADRDRDDLACSTKTHLMVFPLITNGHERQPLIAALQMCSSQQTHRLPGLF